jgi:hypothetical protein
MEERRYRLRVVRGRQRDLFLEQEYSDRESAIQLSALVYRKLKDSGFHDAPRPA